MNFLKSIFSGSKENESISFPWNELTTVSQLKTIDAESMSTTVVVFKHSTRCGISRFSLSNFENQYALPEDSAKLYFLDILGNREISNAIAEKYGIYHESPQLLVIKEGKVVYDVSHGQIDAEKIAEYI
ncbi:bacillithiol system redox-active protein YtxJ [Galbibacter sp. EGI 63066]|uniref:bacillithiol system redox-active protein YtxJ n=1 Tax=Galbibacter sp. EGI 63066 TaxID=2993559 RepID=UPI00224995D2|nr:bacillithiol system redox-active protein YtxJ [Galbibacter sp. EGI 63066]MCX2680819.1 bacillithiol system redox-active protein YtxJ [Galbibacter sp. EGI 63066]